MLDYDKYKYVIAIDFGTSRSGFAYMQAGGVVRANLKWIPYEQLFDYPKTATDLLYRPNSQVVEAWGFDAKEKLAELTMENKEQGFVLLSNFKMALYEKEGFEWGTQRLKIKNGERFLVKVNEHGVPIREFQVVEVIRDYLCHLKDFALKYIREDPYNPPFENQQVLWCLTVPTIWDDEHKQLMRDAAIMAGCISEDVSDKERLLLVFEPEAAAVRCQEEDAANFNISVMNPGTKIMVVDAGGGTVDTTLYRVVSTNGQKSLEEAVPGSHIGDNCGSTYIDRAFLQFLSKQIGSEAMKAILEEESMSYLEMMTSWEMRKCSFDDQAHIKYSFVKFPEGIRDLLRRYPPAIGNLVQAQVLNDERNKQGQLKINNTLMHTFFDPALDKVEKLVERQFSRLGGSTCDFILLVGGFSTSPLFRKRIREHFENHKTKVIFPRRDHPAATIVLGAASLAHDPSKLRVHFTEKTYGTNTCRPFETGDPEGKKIENPRGGFLCDDRFSTFVEAGQKVAFDHEVKRIFNPVYADQREMLIKIYTSPHQNVRYADDRGSQQVGEIRIDRSDLSQGYDWEVEVTMYFGKAEVQVKAKDTKSGREERTRIRFFATFFPESSQNNLSRGKKI